MGDQPTFFRHSVAECSRGSGEGSLARRPQRLAAWAFLLICVSPLRSFLLLFPLSGFSNLVVMRMRLHDSLHLFTIYISIPLWSVTQTLECQTLDSHQCFPPCHSLFPAVHVSRGATLTAYLCSMRKQENNCPKRMPQMVLIT